MVEPKKSRLKFVTEVEPVPVGIIGRILFEKDGGFERRARQLQMRVDEVADFYNIARDPNRYFMLALRLAEDSFPGFSPRKGKGRPSSWTATADALLIIEMDLMIKAGESLRSASSLLARKSHWKAFLNRSTDRGLKMPSGEPAEALRRRHVSVSRKPGKREILELYSSGIADGNAEKLLQSFRSTVISQGRK